MNPSPDRGKECLPPKKRESRQGSTEHHIPGDEFKPPVPLRNRPSTGRGEGGREASDRDKAITNPNPHFLHLFPPGQGLPLSPWPFSYSSPASLPLSPGQVGERRSSGSPSWRDDLVSSTLPQHSRWLRGEGPLTLPPSASSSSPSPFKTPFPADSREMWSYLNSSRRDCSSSLFSPPYLFSHSSLYPPDPSFEARYRYLGKRPNGLDGPGSRTASTSRPVLTGEYGNDTSRSRLDVSLLSSHTNGGRRQQEDVTPRVLSGGTFLSDSQVQECTEPHSSHQDRHPHGIGKIRSNLLSGSSHPLVPDPRAGRGGLLDPVGVPPAEAQIYYSLGSGYHPSSQAQAYPLYSPSGMPLYNLQREPGHRQPSLGNSTHSPLDLPNSHDRLRRDQEQEKVTERNKIANKDKEKHLQHDKGQEKDNERESQRDRDRGRDSSPGQYSRLHTSPPVLHQSPPALLPHFTKGSLIELANGRLKRVEELRTEDFLRSADTSPEFHLSTCTVLLIAPSNAQGFSHLQVHLTDRNTQELLKVLMEYPFFVWDRGWSSCCPQRTTQLYGLPCRQLTEGDVCLALTPTPTQTFRTHVRTGTRTHRTQVPSRATGESGSSHREEMPPPPPPPPLPHHPPPMPPVPPRVVAAEPPAQEQQRPRKRRWSAPDALPATRTDESFSDLPHGSKLMKQQ